MRIIAGSAKGTKLKSPQGNLTRPTADRVKESLFNILGDRVRRAKALDLFAGTGSLGLEALSRGASSCLFIDRATTALLQENLNRTHLEERGIFFKGDVFRRLEFLVAAGESFDLVLADPPYSKGLWQRVLLLFDGFPLLTPAGLLVIEHGAGENDLPELSRLSRVDNRRYGAATQLSFFALKEEDGR